LVTLNVTTLTVKSKKTENKQKVFHAVEDAKKTFESRESSSAALWGGASGSQRLLNKETGERTILGDLCFSKSFEWLRE